jgi:hypothetical protein
MRTDTQVGAAKQPGLDAFEVHARENQEFRARVLDRRGVFCSIIAPQSQEGNSSP